MIFIKFINYKACSADGVHAKFPHFFIVVGETVFGNLLYFSPWDNVNS